jgi:hypothetical protein
MRRHIALAALFAVLPVAACSAAHAAPVSAVAKPLATKTPHNTAPAAPQYTGDQLASVMAPLSYFPTGFTADTATDENSGSSVDTSPGEGQLVGMSCPLLYSYLGAPGLGESSYATSAFGDKSLGYSYVETIYQFPSHSLAGSFFTGFRALVRGCGSFSQDQIEPASQVTLQVHVANDGDGNPAYGIYGTNRFQENGQNYTNNFVYEVVESGTDVYLAETQAGAIGGSRQPPTVLKLDDIIDQLIAGVAKLR